MCTLCTCNNSIFYYNTIHFADYCIHDSGVGVAKLKVLRKFFDNLWNQKHWGVKVDGNGDVIID